MAANDFKCTVVRDDLSSGICHFYRHIVTERVGRRGGSELHAQHQASNRRNLNAVVRYIVPELAIFTRSDDLINLETTLRSIHAGLDHERRRRAASNTFVSPNRIQRIDRLARFHEGIERAESIRIKLADNRVANLIKRPARHASVRTAHDRSRLQFDCIRDIRNLVRRGINLERADEHILLIVPVFVVCKLVFILEERSLDRSEVFTRRKLFTISVIAPCCRGGSTLHSNLRVRIEEDIGCSHCKFDTIERNVLIYRRNHKIRICNFVFASRSREVARSKRSRKLVRTLVRVSKLDGHAVSNIAISPVSIQHQRIQAIATGGLILRNESVVQFCEPARILVSGGKRVAFQALISTVERFRERLVHAFDSKLVRHNPVAVIIRLERFRSNERFPCVAEERLTRRIFVEGEEVLHSLSGHAESQILLGGCDMNRIADIDILRIRRTVIDYNACAERICGSSGELDPKNHFRQSRNFDTVCAQIVPRNIITEHTVNLEATLSILYAGLDRERRRSANRTRSIRSALCRPNRIQRIHISTSRFKTVNRAEGFTIKCTDNVASGSIQRPARQASIRAGHDIKRLQILRLRDIFNRVSFAEFHARAVEHDAIHRKILVVSEPVRILQQRRLDGAEVHAHREHVAVIVIAPYRSISNALDLNLRVGIEDNPGDTADFESDSIERHVAILGRDYKVFSSNNVFAGRSILRAVQGECSRKLVRTLVRTSELDSIASRRALFPESVQHRRIRVLAERSELRNKRVIQFGKHVITVAFSECVTLQTVTIAVQCHRELLVRAIDAVTRFHNPVSVNIRGEGVIINEACPRIAEVRSTQIVFIEREGVIYRIRCHIERHILLACGNFEHLTVTNSLYSPTNFGHDNHSIKRVSRRSYSELYAKLHVRKRRDFKAVRAHVVPSGISTEHAIELEAPLFSRQFRCNRERRRSANITRSIRSALCRPDRIQRTDILAISFKTVNRAEGFTIERTDDITSGSIQSPARQASIGTAHDIARLQRFSPRNTSNRVSFAELHTRAVEHSTVLSKVLVVSERVAVLEERSLDRTEVHAHREHITHCVISPASRSGSTLDREFCIGIENHIRCSHIKHDIVERNIIICRRNHEVFSSHSVSAFRSSTVSLRERTRKLVRTLIGIGKFNSRTSIGASAPVCIQLQRFSTAASSSLILRNKSITQFSKQTFGLVSGSKRVALQARAIAVNRHREFLIRTFHSV